MGKVRDIYRSYSAATLKSRASIPSASDITANASNIDCVNIKASAVKSVLSASNYSLYDLCRHTNVNHWSGFGPTIRGIDGSYDIINSDPTVCKLGDFAGYNHSAPTPGWIDKASTEATIYVNSGSTTQVFFNVTIGELDYLDLGIYGVCFALYNGLTLIANTVVDIEDYENVIEEIGVETPTINSDTTYTGKIFFIDNATTFTGTQKVANVPNVTDASITILHRAANQIIVSAADFQTSDHTPLIAADCSFNSTAGTFTFPAIHSSSSFTELNIMVRLTDVQTGLVDEEIVFSGAYTAEDVIAGDTVSLTGGGGPPYSGYGYTFEFLFEESAM